MRLGRKAGGQIITLAAAISSFRANGGKSVSRRWEMCRLKEDEIVGTRSSHYSQRARHWDSVFLSY